MKTSLLGYNKKDVNDFLQYSTEQTAKYKENIASQTFEINELKSLVESLTAQITDLNAEKTELESKLAELEKGSEEQNNHVSVEQVSVTQKNENFGNIFVVAYHDMAEKNMRVSEKIKDYSRMMFDRITSFKLEAEDTVKNFTQIQEKQCENVKSICEDAIRKLEELKHESDMAILDFEKLEDRKQAISQDIDNMLNSTMMTDGSVIDPETIQR